MRYRTAICRSLYAFIVFFVPILFIFFPGRPKLDFFYSPALYDKNGVLLGAKTASDGQWRFYPEESVSPRFERAIIEYEDSRFFFHPGIDIFAIARAFTDNIRHGKTVSGASTISMQTVRLLSRPDRRTFSKKISEAVRAVRLESAFSKKEIIAMYAANAPFGGNIVGIEAASRRYFGHGPDVLSWAEAAMLAVLPNSPGMIHPGRNAVFLRLKRDALLRRMQKRGFFDAQTLVTAISEELPGPPVKIPDYAPHYLAYKPGKSTLDIGIQKRASEIVRRRAAMFIRYGIMNAAAIIMDTKTGVPLAYVGNIDGPSAPFVDMIRSKRSSGSLLKPFLFAAMLDSGELLPDELISDTPMRIDNYRPENNTGKYEGVVKASEALTRSLNIPAVRELKRYGIGRFVKFLKSMGLTTLFRTPEDYGLPLILGGAEITLLEICGAYARLGRIASGNEKNAPLSTGAAWLTLDALLGVSRPAEEAAWRAFSSAGQISWKTGTSFGFRDAWAIGVTPKVTVGVWVGNADGEGRAELRAAEIAAPLLFDLFSFLDTGTRFEKPVSSLKSIEVCAESGLPSGPYCMNQKEADVPVNARYAGYCTFCKLLTLDESGSRQVRIESVYAKRTRSVCRFVLPPGEEWYYRLRHFDYSPPPPFEGSDDERFMPFTVFVPENSARLYLPVELEGKVGKAVFRAAHSSMKSRLYWHLDGLYFAETFNFHEIEVRPSPGNHILTVIDESGNSIKRSFRVISEGWR